jgi:hypothetical protein
MDWTPEYRSNHHAKCSNPLIHGALPLRRSIARRAV